MQNEQTRKALWHKSVENYDALCTMTSDWAKQVNDSGQGGLQEQFTLFLEEDTY